MFVPVFWIRDILIWIRILESVYWITDLTLLVNGFQDVDKKTSFFGYYGLLVHLH
jgi:hypothetical protein